VIRWAIAVVVIIIIIIVVIGTTNQTQISPDLAPTLIIEPAVEIVFSLTVHRHGRVQRQHDLAKAEFILTEPGHHLVIGNIVVGREGTGDRMGDVRGLAEEIDLFFCLIPRALILQNRGCQHTARAKSDAHQGKHGDQTHQQSSFRLHTYLLEINIVCESSGY
jgi:hypothetical protein